MNNFEFSYGLIFGLVFGINYSNYENKDSYTHVWQLMLGVVLLELSYDTLYE